MLMQKQEMRRDEERKEQDEVRKVKSVDDHCYVRAH
jgi:hypothetical protein